MHMHIGFTTSEAARFYHTPPSPKLDRLRAQSHRAWQAMATTRERNAAHAAIVRSWLDESLAFGALEMAAADLDAVRATCDSAEIEFSDFAGLDEIILAFGETEQIVQAKRMTVDPDAGLDEPLDGEQGAVVDTDGLEDTKAAALCRAAAGYFALFQRPLLALGAYRHVLTLEPRDCEAALGMATALQSVGRRKAAARLALRYWAEGGPPEGTDDSVAGGLLFLLADSAALVTPPSEPMPLLRAVSPYLRTGAAAAVRSLLRRWLGQWAPDGGFEGFFEAERAQSSVTPARRDVCEWWATALATSPSLACCAQLEPSLATARRKLLHFVLNCADPCTPEELEQSVSALASPNGHSGNDRPLRGIDDHVLVLLASIAMHGVFVGFCLPEQPAESRAVAGLCRQLERTGEIPGVKEQQRAMLLAISMYRPLAAVAPTLATGLAKVRMPDRCLEGAGESAALNLHFVEPKDRQDRARDLPNVTVLPGGKADGSENSSAGVQAFYEVTLYPQWRWPETFGFAPCRIGERMRRQLPGFEWAHDAEPVHRVLIAGAGSGHQVAQLLLTHLDCDVVCLDLSAPSLAYSELRLERVLKQQRPRVTSLVADLAQLPMAEDVAAKANAGGLAPLAQRFHLACCIGVLHHIPQPAAVLQRIVTASLLPGGLLQLATYSTLSVRTWHGRARRLLHALLPEVVDEAGGLIRQPTDDELRAVRGKIFALAAEAGDAADAAEDDDTAWSGVVTGDGTAAAASAAASAAAVHELRSTAAMLLKFDEFYCAGGVRDLLFHPCETTFTLIELDEMLRAARCEPVGVFFSTLEADRDARRAYCEAGGLDAHQSDLRRWHEVELKRNQIFGRMHCVWARYLGPETVSANC